MNGKWKAIKELGAYGLVLLCFWQLIQDQRQLSRDHHRCTELLHDIRSELQDIRKELRTHLMPHEEPHPTDKKSP